jgi:hypothetical protein
VRRFFRDGWDFGVFTLAIGIPVAITFVAAIIYIIVNGVAAMPELIASNPWVYGPIAILWFYWTFALVRSLIRPTSDKAEGDKAHG